MRGMVVPPNVTHVQMRFIPSLFTPLALALVITGTLSAAATWFVLRKLGCRAAGDLKPGEPASDAA